MPAIKYAELKQNWEDLIEDDRFTINYNAKIHDSVRIEPYAIIEENTEIGPNTIIGPYSQIRANTKIGSDCKVGSCTVFEGDVIIGNHVRIGSKCTFCWGAVVGDNVFIGDGFQGANDRPMVWGTSEENSFNPNPYRIYDNVRIGLNTTLLAGIILGNGAIIGAGSVVTKSIPANAKAYGNPARVV